ncbi:Nicotinamide-nucleotide amidohydrolase PncC [Corynebacterium occultum]|uniref:Nicotinamide-nucleotide amidohydrolase PncC n=1 Tax=Corynebacterium occultum TaxID=2675219 RepID=A0A6B8W387_9CORY|nr:CinA family protein [Corynebacterium occultum]QGU06971.1 Nicotinamide-nucleotide amidohydrolase PncC [Corynebacterium occultum]
MSPLPEPEATAEEISLLARRHGFIVAAAESLTGGKISSRLCAAESSSEWFAGGVVSYFSRVKREVLGVPENTPVISEAAVSAMATGLANLMKADSTVAVSGAGGPEGQEGNPPGTTWIAVQVRGQIHTELHHFPGAPEDILAQTESHALHLLHQTMVENSHPDNAPH